MRAEPGLGVEDSVGLPTNRDPIAGKLQLKHIQFQSSGARRIAPPGDRYGVCAWYRPVAHQSSTVDCRRATAGLDPGAGFAVLGTMGTWLISGRELSQSPDYLRLATEIARGYSDGMSRYGGDLEMFAALTLLIVLAAAGSWRACVWPKPSGVSNCLRRRVVSVSDL